MKNYYRALAGMGLSVVAMIVTVHAVFTYTAISDHLAERKLDRIPPPPRNLPPSNQVSQIPTDAEWAARYRHPAGKGLNRGN